MKANNPTPTTLDEIIAKIAGQVFDFALDDGDRNEAVYSATAEATQSIQQQLKALLPKKNKFTLAVGSVIPTKDGMVEERFLELMRNTAQNQAIDQIEKAIDDFCSGKGKE